MPRRKINDTKITSARDYQVLVQPFIQQESPKSQFRRYTRSLKRASKRTQSSDLEVPSRTTAKRKKAGQPPSWRQRQRRPESRADTEAKDMPVEDSYTPLTRANIPMIVNAGLSNLTTSSTGEAKNTPDNALPGE